MALRPVLEPASVATGRQRMIFETLRHLVLFDLPKERKLRLGRPGDGSYVLVDRLRPAQPVMSFGIGPSASFELDVAERGHHVLLFDHTIDELPERHPHFTWYREGIADRSVPEHGLRTLAEHLSKLPAGCDAPILKLDVEGDEWAIFESAPVALLRHFEQIAVEFHSMDRIESPDFIEIAHRVFAKLAANFTLCHVHANNFCSVKVLAGCFPMPETLELTYVRTDLIVRAPSATTYPTSLDTPNYHQFADLMMWYFPFLPGSDLVAFPES